MWSPAEVDAVVERIEATIEAQAPGFRTSIVGRARERAGRPGARRTPTWSAGPSAAARPRLYQQLSSGPLPGLGRADTAVDRLYLASAAAHPGGGVHGGPGANAARAAIARDRFLAGSLYGAAVRSAHRRIYRG